jgi:hypothetical protein
MEQHFGTDFSGVRVHRGEPANEANRALSARAFTHGSDIFLGGDASPADRGLMAHELTHVVQQTANDTTDRVQRQTQHDLTRETVQPETLASLSDDDLQTQSLNVRRRMGQLKPDDPEYVALRQNLHLLENEAAQRFVKLPSPEPNLEPYVYQRRPLTDDPVWLRYLLEQMIIEKGQTAAERFVMDFGGPLAERHTGDPKTEAEIQDYRHSILPVLRGQLEILKKENSDFLDEFKSAAKETLAGLLAQSKERIDRERVRYRLPTPTRYTVARADETLEEFGVVQTPGLTELSAAATLLLKLRTERDARLGPLQNRRAEYQSAWDQATRQGDQADVNVGELSKLYDQMDKIDRTVALENRRYEAQKGELARRFPILASFADEGDTKKLEQLSTGATVDVLTMLMEDIYEKLSNIETVQEDLDNDDVNIWKLPRLISATRLKLHIADGTMRERILQDKIQDVADAGFWKSVGLGVLQLGLVLLAPLTEGASLYAAAAVSGGMLISHAEEYVHQKALTGTDFDKALAISADKPSLFWLALDAVFFLADASAALNAFRVLETLASEVRAARTAEEAQEAVRALEEAAEHQGGKEFAERVVADAHIGAEVSQTQRIFGEAGHALEEAGKVADREAAQAVLAELISETGDAIKVTKSGHLIVCSQPCQWLRDRFARQIAKDANFEQRVADLESFARTAAMETDEAAARRLAEEIAADTGTLQRDLAYAEYLGAGGTATLEEFSVFQRAQLLEFRGQAVAAQRRVTDAAESLRRAQESARTVHGELAYYRAETEKTAKQLAAKQAEAELHEAEAAAMRADPARVGEAEAADQLAAQARADAAKLEKELKSSQSLVAHTEREAQKTTESVKTAERQSEAMTASQRRQNELSQQLDALQARYDTLPEVQAQPHLYRNIPPPSAEGIALKREMDAIRQELRKQIEAATESTYNRLRGISPGPLAKQSALRNLRAELRAPGGPIDVTNPGAVLSRSEISPDHIYSLRRITEEEGFNRLTPRQQEYIVEMTENYTPLSVAANQSKGDLLLSEWFLTPIGSRVPPDIRDVLRQVETSAIDRIRKQIKDFLQ